MIYRFGSFSLDTDLLELRNNDSVVQVEPQVFALLAFLIENADRVVTKDEIIDAVWHGRIISDGNLNSRINAARRAVGDDGKAQSVIKTFPRRGFRFVAEANNADSGVTISPRIADDFGRPSVIVLPFDNLSGEQDHICDGITEDIIAALRRTRLCSVVARNTTFTYKGQAVDVQAVAHELGVRYVLEGSVRKAGNRIRISVQLNDGEKGTQLWSEHFDRDLEDIFSIQDEITRSVVAAIEPTMAKAERERTWVKKPRNLGAWDYYHRGMSHVFDQGETGQPDELDLAEACFLKSMELDPNFSRAHSGLATCLLFQGFLGMEKSFDLLEKAIVAAKKAIELDEDDAYARAILGAIHHHNRQPEAAIRECRMALEIDPSFSRAHLWLGISILCAGNASEGMNHLNTALRLGRRDPARGAMFVWSAMGHLFTGEYEMSADAAKEALMLPTTQFWGNVALTAALSYLERVEEAKAARQVLQDRRPNITCDQVKVRSPITDSDYEKILLDGLRRAGLPEF